MFRAKSKPDPDSVSTFRTLFLYAWRRIWEGQSGRGARGLEITLWSVFAFYLGIQLTYNIPAEIDGIFANVVYWAIVILTPMEIGAQIYRAHASMGSADESLRTIPVDFNKIVFPRMAAVGISYLRTMLPLVILFYITWIIPMTSLDTSLNSKITSVALNLLALFPLDRWHQIYSQNPVWMNFIPWICALIWTAGFVTIPITWGFWWATRFKYSASGFLFLYFFYLLIPAALLFYIEIGYSTVEFSRGEYWRMYSGAGGWEFKLMMLQAFCMIAITLFIHRVPGWLMGRRTK